MLTFLWKEQPLWPLRLLWLFAREPQHRVPSARKLRLFLCACVQKDWDLVDDDSIKRAISIAEQFADGLVSRERFDSGVSESILTVYASTSGLLRASTLLFVMNAIARHSVNDSLRQLCIVNALAYPQHAPLLRHIVGNPFRQYPVPSTWPAAVVELAVSVYGGNDCAHILADSLEETGHAVLSEHMRAEPWHPKGCWVLDLLLGKS